MRETERRQREEEEALKEFEKKKLAQEKKKKTQPKPEKEYKESKPKPEKKRKRDETSSEDDSDEYKVNNGQYTILRKSGLKMLFLRQPPSPLPSPSPRPLPSSLGIELTTGPSGSLGSGITEGPSVLGSGITEGPSVMPEPREPEGPVVNSIPSEEGRLSPSLTTVIPNVFHLPASLTFDNDELFDDL